MEHLPEPGTVEPHCTCPLEARPLVVLVDVRGATCKLCNRRITTASYDHWGVKVATP